MNDRADNRLYLLGALRLECRGSEVKLSRRKVASLLAYLVLHPLPHGRDHLAALLWGDYIDDEARASLRNALSLLRRALGEDAFIADSQSVQINPTFPLWVDTRAFESYAREFLGAPSFDLSPSFIDLYQGDLLPGLYDDWIGPERDRLRALYIEALLQAVQQMRSRSDYARAIDLGQRVLTTEPSNERAHQHLMFCHVARGDRSAALRQYEACRHALHEDLAVEPLAETTELYEWIKGTPAHERAREARRTNLPIPLTSFIGREQEMAALKRLLAEQRLVTVTGPGGCGKTRLAIQVATDLVDAYRDGVWLVDLAGVQSESLVVQAVGRVLDAQTLAGDGALDDLCAFVRPRRLLLVLDNCEHVVDGCARLAAGMLAAAPGLRIIATSREVLGLAGEAVWTVGPLATPPATVVHTLLADLVTYEGTRLFVERAAAASPGLALGERDAAAVAAVCRGLDGMPLAIELAAARVRAMPVRELAEHLGERFRLLASAGHGAPARQRSLQETIAWSYDLLAPDEQALLRSVSVFVGGFTAQGAAAVYTEQADEAAVLDVLSRLVDKSLVIAETREGVPRYRLLETIRMYAWERLGEAGEQDAVVRRFVPYMVRWAKTPGVSPFGSEVTSFLPSVHRYDLDHDNLRAAVTWSRQTRQYAEGITLMDLWNYWTWRDEDVSEFRDYCQSPLPVGDLPLRERAYFYIISALLARSEGDYVSGLHHARSYLEAAKQLGDQSLEAHAWQWIGRMQLSMDYLDQAEQSLAASWELRPDEHVPMVLAWEPEMHLRRGDLQQARQGYQDVLRWLERQRRTYLVLWATAQTVVGLAQVEHAAGDDRAATRLARQALRLFGDMEHRAGLVRALIILAVALTGLGLTEAAACLWGYCFGPLGRMAGSTGRGDVSGNIGEAYNKTMNGVRRQLGDKHYADLRARGWAMTWGEMVTYALSLKVDEASTA